MRHAGLVGSHHGHNIVFIAQLYRVGSCRDQFQARRVIDIATFHRHGAIAIHKYSRLQRGRVVGSHVISHIESDVLILSEIQ